MPNSCFHTFCSYEKLIPTCSYVVYIRSLKLMIHIVKECIFVYMPLVIICSETISFVFHLSQKFVLCVSGKFSQSRSHILIFKLCIYMITSFSSLKSSISFLNCSTRLSFSLNFNSKVDSSTFKKVF